MKDIDELAVIHERLGNEYLDTMKRNGIAFPPPVGWETFPALVTGTTSAVILFDDHVEEVCGVPRGMLAAVVAARAMAGCVMTDRN